MRQVKSKKTNIFARTTFKIKLICLGIILLITAVVAFFASKTGQNIIDKVTGAYHAVVSKSHLTLQRMDLEGHQRTKTEEVMQVLSLQQGMPILDVDLFDIQARVAELPWVDSVSVERHLPDAIHIRIHEKTPIAVWQNNKKYFPLDETGEPIDDHKTVLKDLTLNGMILVVGRDAPEYTPELIEILRKYPEIHKLVESAVRIGDRRWNLNLRDVNNGTVIYLPETDIEAALERLIEWQETEQVLDKDFKMIDLRIEDRLIVRTDANLDEEKE